MSSEPASFTTSTIVANTESASHTLKIDGYSRTKGLATGIHLKSCNFIAGGHSWHLAYLPNGDCAERSEYISIYLVLNGVAPGTSGGPVLAQFSISLLDRAGKPAPTYTRTATTTPYVGPGAHWGFPGFIRRDALEKSRHLNVKDDSFSVRCDLTVVTEFRAVDAASIAAEAASSPLSVPVPPPDMWRHLEHLLLSQLGADVRFRVDRVDFAAHRCVLAARSPVFQAELFGTMKEASSEAQCVVEIHDMRADVFKNLLYFIYTDALPLPEPEEPRPDPEEEALMAQHLLVAADRYGMERLKFICEDALCRHIDVSTVATTMALAEQHHCQGIKEACFQFLRSPGALNTVMATDDFDHLATSCPSLIKELISKLAAR
ncbi:hypothetical protein C2845_PM01G42450 [Panicum miliaceum]|uniref:BTB/POZ and MATH domain-containing protein 2-like n=1 Tax=Panicum miliaceum TaxID=4540 RepID=A0A3L6TIN4_PANMI|nr:hypothetical protein C2845_PM01G42450 [Panicum miliaceum]